MNNSINKYIIKEEIEFLIKQNRSMRTEDNFIDEVFNLEEVLKNRYKGEENAKLIDEYLINEYKQVRDIFRTKAFSQFINMYVHICLIVYNTITKQNNLTIDHWKSELSTFYNEINNNRFTEKEKNKLLDTVFEEFSNNSKVQNAFFLKLEKEYNQNKKLQINTDYKIAVANVVFKHFNLFYQIIIDNILAKNSVLSIPDNFFEKMEEECKKELNIN